jgi:hypothetical protein
MRISFPVFFLSFKALIGIMAAPADKKDVVVLQTSDDELFTVDKKVAGRSAMIKVMLDGEL